MPLIEYYAVKQQFNARDSVASESDGAYTRDSQIATDLLEVLNQIGASDEDVLRLWRAAGLPVSRDQRKRIDWLESYAGGSYTAWVAARPLPRPSVWR